MSAGQSGSIWGVSARYAAQIEELLYVRAIERMVADQESVRSERAAERAAQVEKNSRINELEPAVKVDVETRDLPDPVRLPELEDDATPPPATLVDVQA